MNLSLSSAVCLVHKDSGLPSSLVPVKPQQEDGVGPRDSDLGHVTEVDSPESVAEGAEDHDEHNSSYQLSEALNHHFYYSNGVLRPRPHSNAILLHPRGQVI